MSRKIILLLAAALIGAVAVTTACNKNKEKRTKADEEAEMLVEEQNTPEILAKKYFTATTFESILALEPDCAPDYAEYLNGQKIGGLEMFPLLKKFSTLVKIEDPDAFTTEFINIFNDDQLWKLMLTTMGAAAPGQVSEEDLQAMRNMMLSAFRRMNTDQKRTMMAKMKKGINDNIENRTKFFKDVKITGTKIEGDTAVVTAEAEVTGETDPEVAAILGDKVGYELTLKMIDGKWKYQTFKTNFNQ